MAASSFCFVQLCNDGRLSFNFEAVIIITIIMIMSGEKVNQAENRIHYY